MTVIAVLGPTAAGKSELAIRLARELDGEILSVDSMQVYRGMDIGTAKPTPAERAEIAHHLIDIADVADDFSVSEFQVAGRNALSAVSDRGRVAIIAGGTGLHFRSLVDPLDFPPTDPAIRAELEGEALETLRTRLMEADAAAGDHVDLANARRVVRALEVLRLTGLTPSDRAADPRAAAVRDYLADTPFVGLGVDPGGDLAERIATRFDRMLDVGLMDEVRGLEPTMGRVARQAVGYKELVDVIHGRIDFEEGRARAIAATSALAKRQRTFFRRDPRLTWLPPGPPDTVFEAACEIIAATTGAR